MVVKDWEVEMGMRVERHVVLNSDLEILFSVDPADKVYRDPLFHYQRPDIDRALRQRGNISPALEIVILSHEGGSYSYRILLSSSSMLGKETWKMLGELVESELKRFEKDRFHRKVGLFDPARSDEVSPKLRKALEETRLRLLLIDHFRQCYEEVRKKVRAMIRKGRSSADIASEFDVSERDVVDHWRSGATGRFAPAALAKSIVTRWIQQEGFSELLGIYSVEQFEDRLLHRPLEVLVPPARRRVIKGRTLYVVTGEPHKF